MSQPDLKSASGGRGLFGDKPRANIYTVFLILALVAMLLACLFLVLEVKYQKSGQPFFDPVRPVKGLALPRPLHYA